MKKKQTLSYLGILAILLIFAAVMITRTWNTKMIEKAPVTEVPPKPDELSPQLFELGLEALDTIDQYLDGNMTAEEAEEAFEGFSNRAGRISDLRFIHENNDLLGRHISSLQHKLRLVRISITLDDTDVLRERNNIAELLGLEKRE